MLLVRLARHDRNGALAKRAHKNALMLADRLDAATVLLAKALPIERPDAGADECVRQVPASASLMIMLMVRE